MRVIGALGVLHVTVLAAFAADLTPQTKRAFDRYIQITEARLERTLNRQNFLYSDLNAEQKAKLRKGDVQIMPQKALENHKEIDVPGGLVRGLAGNPVHSQGNDPAGSRRA